MNAEPSVPLWVLMLFVGALGTLVTIGIYMVVSHFREDQKIRERVAVHDEQIKTIKEEIGDRKTGIRGWLHELANDVSPYIMRKQNERDK